MVSVSGIHFMEERERGGEKEVPLPWSGEIDITFGTFGVHYSESKDETREFGPWVNFNEFKKSTGLRALGTYIESENGVVPWTFG